MKSKVAQRILEQTPDSTKEFIREYSDLLVKMNSLLRERGYLDEPIKYEKGKWKSSFGLDMKGDKYPTAKLIIKKPCD